MNEIITKLNEIEEKADAIIAEANARKEALTAQIELEKREIDAKYDRLEQEAAETYRRKRKGEAGEQMQQKETLSREAAKRLEDSFAQNREIYADEIFSRIVQ